MTTKEQFTELANLTSSIFTVASHSNTKDLHSHNVGQLSVPQNGTMYLIVDDKLYIIPPHVAIFIPKNTKHQIYKINQRIIIENIYFTDKYNKLLPQTVSTITLSELSQALIFSLCRLNKNALDSDKSNHMLSLLLSELRDNTSRNPYTVTIPKNQDLLKVFDYLTASIDILPNLDMCSKLINVSIRTLQRMVVDELNVSFILWRQQILFVRAVEMLEREHKTSVIAYKLGYNSESAFISMFKKMSGGCVPSKYTT